MAEPINLRQEFLDMLSAALEAVAANPTISPPPKRPPQPRNAPLVERAWDPARAIDLLGDLAMNGCLLLREFITPEHARQLAEIGARSFAEIDANLARTACGERQIPSVFSFLRDEEPDIRRGNDRHLRNFGGMPIETVPFAGHELFKLLRASGLLPLVQAYIGGRPLISGGKCSLRLGDKDAPVRHVFHQDGAFLGGRSARTLNIWIALTDAGVDAPGLEILPDRLEEILPVGQEGAAVPWEVSADWVYRRFGRDRLVVPRFRAGDAILFDQMSLHRTHVTSDMTRLRLAYECWFFPPDPTYRDLQLLAL